MARKDFRRRIWRVLDLRQVVDTEDFDNKQGHPVSTLKASQSAGTFLPTGTRRLGGRYDE